MDLTTKYIFGHASDGNLLPRSFAGVQGKIKLTEEPLDELVFWQILLGNQLHTQKGDQGSKTWDSSEYSIELGASKKLSPELLASVFGKMHLDKLSPDHYFFARDAVTLFGNANVSYSPGENRFTIIVEHERKDLQKIRIKDDTSFELGYGYGYFDAAARFKAGLDTKEIGAGIGYGNKWKIKLDVSQEIYKNLKIPPTTKFFLGISIPIGEDTGRGVEKDQSKAFNHGGVYPEPVINKRLSDIYDSLKNVKDLNSLAFWTGNNYDYNIGLAQEPEYSAFLIEKGAGVCHNFSDFQAWAAKQMGYNAYRLDYYPDMEEGHSIELVETKDGVYTLEYGRIQKIDVPLNASYEEKIRQALAQGTYVLGFSGSQKVFTQLYLPPDDPFSETGRKKVAGTNEEIVAGKPAKVESGLKKSFPNMFGDND